MLLKVIILNFGRDSNFFVLGHILKCFKETEMGNHLQALTN